MKIPLSSLGREVEILPRTYRVEKAYNMALLDGVKVPMANSAEQVASLMTEMSLPAINTINAAEVEIKLLFSLSDDELGRLTGEEIEQLKKEIEAQKTEKKS